MALEALRELLSCDNHMRIRHAFLIPVRGRDGDQPTDFPVQAFPRADMTQVDEMEAREAVIEALTFIDFKDVQHPKATLRTPGLCEVSDEVLEAIRTTNKMRQEIGDLVAQDRNPDERTRFWRTQRGVCPLQVIRQTLILDRPEHLRFYWVKDGSFKKYRVGELIEVVMRNRGIDHRDKAPFWLAPIWLMNKDELVAVKPPGYPQVRARIKAQFVKIDKASGEPTTLDSLITGASVPFVYRMGHPAPVVIPLPPKAEKSPKKCLDKRQQLETKPHIEKINLYRYRFPEKAKEPLTTSHRNTIRTSRVK